MRTAAPVAVALLCAAWAGCGPDGPGPHPARPEVTRGIEHLRVLQVTGGVRTVTESWEYRPADGCWRSRVRSRGGAAPPSDILSTVAASDGGAARRVVRVEGPPRAQPGEPCAGASPTGLQLLRRIVADAGLRPAGTVRVAGRPVRVLTGPPDAVLLGMADPSRSTSVARITVRPPGARMRMLWDPATRMPVRISTPRVEVVLDAAGDLRQTVPPMTQVYLAAEELPATPANLRVFALP